MCSIESFRRLLNVECDAAIAVANIIGITIFVVLMIVCLIVVKKRSETMIWFSILLIRILKIIKTNCSISSENLNDAV